MKQIKSEAWPEGDTGGDVVEGNVKSIARHLEANIAISEEMLP